MNTNLLTILLGAVQGLSEFLPISSSAHLDMLHKLIPSSRDTSGLLFDVVLHLGTLVALTAYFWREWMDMFKANMALRKIKDQASPLYAELKAKSMPLWPLIIATIPGGLAGVILEKKVKTVLDSPMIVGCSLIIFGILLYVADRSVKGGKPMQKATLKDWIIVGCAQACAIIPGVSRSGSTITASLFCGLRREAAARFSFLLSAPIIFGAGLWELRKVAHLTPQDILPFILGLASAALVGYVVIGYLLEYLKRRSTLIFMVYRILLGVVLISAYMTGHLGR